MDVQLLIRAKEFVKEYQNNAGCRFCKSKAEIVIKAIDELMLLHAKAKEFNDVLNNLKYLRDVDTNVNANVNVNPPNVNKNVNINYR